MAMERSEAAAKQAKAQRKREKKKRSKLKRQLKASSATEVTACMQSNFERTGRVFAVSNTELCQSGCRQAEADMGSSATVSAARAFGIPPLGRVRGHVRPCAA